MTSFVEELQKIAGIGKNLADTLKWGYYGNNPAVATAASKWGRMGTWGRQGMLNLGPAVEAREALRSEDSTGQGRSKAQRLTTAAGGIGGSYLGAGALLRSGALGKGSVLLPSLLGGAVGGMGGSALTSQLWRRRHLSEAQRSA
jgi:hypothetical protein